MNALKSIFSKTNIFILALFLVGLLARLYHIEFGLPHSFHADEPEIAEVAIKYTYELKDILKNGSWYKLIPISFVYGTVPAYFFTFAVMAFSKSANLLNIAFDKTTLFVFMRVVNAGFTLIIPLVTILLYKILFDKEKFAKYQNVGLILVAIFAIFNWKLIVHAHYLNPDILLTEFLSLLFLTLVLYIKNPKGTWIYLAGLFFGLAVGTKITALISIPAFIYVFARKMTRDSFARYTRKIDLYGFLGFCLIGLTTFMITNPFSFIMSDNFALRILEMFTKERGMVFDSVDSNPFKYILALFNIAPEANIFLASLGFFGLIKKAVKEKAPTNLDTHIFLFSNVIIYILFFSLGQRRVDRWMLPIVPILIVYAVSNVIILLDTAKKPLDKVFTYILIGIMLAAPITMTYILAKTFHTWTPKSAAYLWMKENTDPLKFTLGITEEGLDPIDKLPNADVIKYQVYEAESAQLFYPPNPTPYNYVVIASRPMQNFKRKEVQEKYPDYAQKWNDFEQDLYDQSKFKMIKAFDLAGAKYIDVSEVYVFENLNPQPQVLR